VGAPLTAAGLSRTVTGEPELAAVAADLQQLAAAVGLDTERTAGLAQAAGSLARWVLQRAGAAQVTMGPLAGNGLEVVAAGQLVCSAAQLAELVSRAEHDGGAGTTEATGAAARWTSQVDELDVDVRLGESLSVTLRCRTGPGHELAVVGRPRPGQITCGDDAGQCWLPSGWRAIVADGLGHGPAARESAQAAVACAAGKTQAPLPDVVTAMDEHLHGRRGATVALVEWDAAHGQLTHLGIGDVSGLLLVPGTPGAHRFVAVPGTVGARPRARRPVLETQQPPAGAVLVLATDGLRVQLDGRADRALLVRHPVAIAAHLLATQATPTDDALALVVHFR
jgi:hypothetical protein